MGLSGWYFACILLNLQFFAYVFSAEPITTRNGAMKFLEQFGYMDEKSLEDQDLPAIQQSVSDYQAMMGLPMTGEFDEETMSMMNRPRCGNPDTNRTTMRSKRQNFTPLGRWRQREVTYIISSYPTGLDRNTVRTDIQNAFTAWQNQANLNFVQVNAGTSNRGREPDIILKFASGSHGNVRHDAFDGAGRVLAHAFAPGAGIGGDVHFDQSETWTARSNRGTNFFQVAVHEIGHALGLPHTNVRGAIMFPTYTGYVPNFSLHSDDISRIRSIYGARGNGGAPARTTPRPRRPRPRGRLGREIGQI